MYKLQNKQLLIIYKVKGGFNKCTSLASGKTNQHQITMATKWLQITNYNYYYDNVESWKYYKNGRSKNNIVKIQNLNF